MRCPFCAHSDTHVKDLRPTEDNTAIRPPPRMPRLWCALDDI